MKALKFSASSTFPAPVAALWCFHLRPDALEILSPPLTPTRVLDRGDGVAEGSEVVLEVGRWPFRVHWRALHTRVSPEVEFVDVALDAPFPYWVHLHRFEAMGHEASRLTDTVWYLPPAWLPRPAARPVVGLMLTALFWWRHRRTRRALELATASGPANVRLEATRLPGE